MTTGADSLRLGSYNAAVRSAFQDPRHAIAAPAGSGQRFESRASESLSGAQILLMAEVEGGILAAFRFQVFGCPHLIAAAEVCCERFEGGPVNELDNFAVSVLMETLGVPVEKTGRILLLEDAVRSLLLQIGGAATNRM